MNKYEIIYLHGLFGENLLSPSKKIDRIISPYEISSIADLSIDSDCIIIGYSMGARKLLEILLKNKCRETLSRIKKVHLISCHLSTQNREKRRKYEDDLIKKMSDRNFESFWNSLPLFKNDYPINIDVKKMSYYKKIFDRNRLSKTPSYVDYIQKEIELFQLHCGEDDEKIYIQYKDFSNAVIYPKLSHRSVLKKIDFILGDQDG